MMHTTTPLTSYIYITNLHNPIGDLPYTLHVYSLCGDVCTDLDLQHLQVSNHHFKSCVSKC